MAQQQRQVNWQQPGGDTVQDRLVAGVNEYTDSQCRDVIYTLHSMHKSFDRIIASRDATGTFKGSSQMSFAYGITLERYLNDHDIDITNVNRDVMCTLLFDDPGKLNDSNGLLGWYCEDRMKPVLCQIISPWDEIRYTQVEQFTHHEGLHYGKYQLRQWRDKYTTSWAEAERYEDAYNDALKQYPNMGSRDLAAKIIEINDDISQKTQYPFLPTSCATIVEYNNANKIAKLLWDEGWLLSDNDTEDVLRRKIQEIMNKSMEYTQNQKKNAKGKAAKDKIVITPFSGKDATLPPKMREWLHIEGGITARANSWMCENTEDCFDEIDDGCSTDLWDPQDPRQKLKIQVLTKTAEEPFSFSAIGQELELSPDKFSSFFLLPKVSHNIVYRIVYGERIIKDDFYFTLTDPDNINYSLDFSQRNPWRRYLQGTIRDDYDKFGTKPTEQLKVKTARACPPCDDGSDAFGDLRRNATPAILSNAPKGGGGLVCAICCKKPKNVQFDKDKWGEALNPTFFARVPPGDSRKKTIAVRNQSQEYDVDHIANLIFNALLDLNYTGMGFLNTCAGCNRHLKGEKLWSPSIDLWRILIQRAGLDIGTYPWPGRFSPGLTQNGKLEKKSWKEEIFEGNRVYTIKAFYNQAEENSYFKMPEGQMKAQERKKKKAEIDARKKLFMDGQGLTNPKSSSNFAGSVRSAIPPEYLELVILDRYMRTILRDLPQNTTVVSQVIHAENTLKNGRSGANIFVRAYQKLISVFPATAMYEEQSSSAVAAVDISIADGNKIARETEKIIHGISPPRAKRRDFSTDSESYESDDPGSDLSQHSRLGTPVISRSNSVQNASPAAAAGHGAVAGSGAVGTANFIMTGLLGSELYNRPFSNTMYQEQQRNVRGRGVQRYVQGRVQGEMTSRLGWGKVEGLLGFDHANAQVNVQVEEGDALSDPPPRNEWSTQNFTHNIDSSLSQPALINIPDYINRLSRAFIQYVIDEGWDEPDWFSTYKTYENKPLSEEEKEYIEANMDGFKQFIIRIAQTWEPHFTYRTLLILKGNWKFALGLSEAAERVAIGTLKNRLGELNKMLVGVESTAKSGSPQTKKSTAKTAAAAMKKYNNFEEEIRKTNYDVKRTQVALSIIEEMIRIRDKKNKQLSKKAKRKAKDALYKSMETEQLTYEHRLDKLKALDPDAAAQIVKKPRLSPIIEVRKKPNDGNLDVDVDVVGNDGSDSSSLGSSSGFGSGSNSGSGSGSGSDDLGCEIPALTQQENEDFIELINKDSTNKDGSPWLGVEKRTFDDQLRVQQVPPHPRSSYNPFIPQGNNMALKIFKLRKDWANGEINYIDMALYRGFMVSGAAQGLGLEARQQAARTQARNGADIGEPTTNFLLTEDMVPQLRTVLSQNDAGQQVPVVKREQIHWWSGDLILAALNKYCSMGGWDSVPYGEENTRTPPTIIQSVYGDGNIQLRLDGQHWQFWTRPNDNADWERVHGERIGGDCGPCVVILAIDEFNRQREDDVVPMDMSGGKRKTRKKYKRKYRKKTRRK